MAISKWIVRKIFVLLLERGWTGYTEGPGEDGREVEEEREGGRGRGEGERDRERCNQFPEIVSTRGQAICTKCIFKFNIHIKKCK